jgi:hypothetical protein
MTACAQTRVSHRDLRVANANIAPKLRVPHLHDGFIVVKVGIVRNTTAPAHLVRTPESQATN